MGNFICCCIKDDEEEPRPETNRRNIPSHSEPTNSNVREKIPQSNYNRESKNIVATNNTEHRSESLIISKPTAPQLIKHNQNLLNNLSAKQFSFTLCANDKLFQLENLDRNSIEYTRLIARFLKNNQRCFIVDVRKVHNLYLMLQYSLKKTMYCRTGKSFKEELMFHGTHFSNIDSIFLQNFDWRLSGSNHGTLFGQGVCFSPFASYATHYGKRDIYNKVMIAAKVLVTDSCIGNTKMVIPPMGYDTSKNPKNSVFVKYEDNTFYPTYLIVYRFGEKNNFPFEY